MAGQFATSIKAKKLVLTHFSMRHSTPGSEFTVTDILRETRDQSFPHGELVAADDLMVMDIAPRTWSEK
jgi:ribonuclease BN (tRNA processing enzyme)